MLDEFAEDCKHPVEETKSAFAHGGKRLKADEK